MGAGIAAVGTVAAPTAWAAGPQTVEHFSYGELSAAGVGSAGCGENSAGEPAIHVSRSDNVFLGSELGLGGGSELWRGLGALGGGGASGCGLEYRGQPNAVAGVGASGGDIDIALASAPNTQGNYNVYVSSLNLASVNVASSSDDATSFTQIPVQGGLPADDREWIAAFGAETSLLTFHEIATNNIEVLRSDDGGKAYVRIASAIPVGDYREASNELGNIVIDHRNLPDATGDFYAYQAFVAPSQEGGSHNNEAFLAVSADGGHTWSDRPISTTTSRTSPSARPALSGTRGLTTRASARPSPRTTGRPGGARNPSARVRPRPSSRGSRRPPAGRTSFITARRRRATRRSTSTSSRTSPGGRAAGASRNG
jgi:hypothetical protein